MMMMMMMMVMMEIIDGDDEDDVLNLGLFHLHCEKIIHRDLAAR